MRVPSGMGFDQVDELCARLGDWEIVGPNGEYYGQFKEKPSESQVPLYAMIKEVPTDTGIIRFKGGEYTMSPG